MVKTCHGDSRVHFLKRIEEIVPQFFLQGACSHGVVFFLHNFQTTLTQASSLHLLVTLLVRTKIWCHTDTCLGQQLWTVAVLHFRLVIHFINPCRSNFHDTAPQFHRLLNLYCAFAETGLVVEFLFSPSFSVTLKKKCIIKP